MSDGRRKGLRDQAKWHDLACGVQIALTDVALGAFRWAGGRAAVTSLGKAVKGLDFTGEGVIAIDDKSVWLIGSRARSKGENRCWQARPESQKVSLWLGQGGERGVVANQPSIRTTVGTADTHGVS